MKSINIWKDENIGFYTIAIDGEIKYECLAADEVAAIIDEIMKERD